MKEPGGFYGANGSLHFILQLHRHSLTNHVKIIIIRVDKKAVSDEFLIILYTLIKSGGGNGPVKPGNLRCFAT